VKNTATEDQGTLLDWDAAQIHRGRYKEFYNGISHCMSLNMCIIFKNKHVQLLAPSIIVELLLLSQKSL
jgi:hypothetical protein